MVAAPEPEMAAKNMPASTETTDRPPLIMPSRDSQNSTSTLEILPPASRSPAKMKNGTAIRLKESQLANMRCTTIIILAVAETRKHRRRGGGTDGERDRHAQQQKGDKHAEQNQCH